MREALPRFFLANLLHGKSFVIFVHPFLHFSGGFKWESVSHKKLTETKKGDLSLIYPQQILANSNS